MANTTNVLVQQAEAALHERMSSVEDSVVEANVDVLIEKETATETPESTRGSQLPFEEEETSNSNETDSSNPSVQIPEGEASEAVSPFDTGVMKDEDTSLVIETGHGDLLDMINSALVLVQQTEVTLHEKNSTIEDSIGVTHAVAGTAKETACKTSESTRALQISVLEDEASEAVSAFDTGAMTDEDSYLGMETGNNKLLGMTKTVSAMVDQAEATLNEQMSSIGDSVIVTQHAAGIGKETANETPESTGDLQISFEEEEGSSSYEIEKSNLTVPILEVEASEAVPTFETDALAEEDTNPVVEIGNNNIPEMTTIVHAVVQQAEDDLHDQTSSVQDSVVVANVAALIEKETASETPGSTRDSQLPFEEEETSNSHENDKSNLSVQIPEDEASEAVSPIEKDAMKDEDTSLVIKTEKSDLPDMINSAPVLVQPTEATLHEKNSSIEDSIVVTHAVARAAKETACETSESNVLQISIEEEEAPGSNETDTSNLMIHVLKGEASEAVSAFKTGAMTDEDSSQFIETEDNGLLGMANIAPVQVQKAEATLYKQMSSTEDSMDATHVAVGIEKETSSETPESARDLQISFEGQEALCSHETDKSNLTVQILEVEVSAFDTGAMTDKDITTAIESGYNDLQEMTNTAPALVQQAEAIQHEQMSSVEDLVVATHIAAGIENETAIETPKILEVEASEAVSTFDKGAVTEDNSPVIEMENSELLGMPNTQPALVQQAEATINEQMSSIEDSVLLTHVAIEIKKETAPVTPQSTRDLQLSYEEEDAGNVNEMENADAFQNEEMKLNEDRFPHVCESWMAENSEEFATSDATDVPFKKELGAVHESLTRLEVDAHSEELNNTIFLQGISNTRDATILTEAFASLETEEIMHTDANPTAEVSKEVFQSMTEPKVFQGMSRTLITLINEEEKEEATINERTKVLSEDVIHAVVVNEKDSESESPEAFSNLEIQATAQKFVTLPDVKTDEVDQIHQQQLYEENLSQEMQTQIESTSQSLKTSDNVSKPSLGEQMVDPIPAAYEPTQFQPKDETRIHKIISNAEEETIIADDSTLLIPVSIWKEDIIPRNDQEVLQSIKLEDLQGMSKKEQQNEAKVDKNPSVLHHVVARINETVPIESKDE